jgi:hypothetical protein
MRSPAILPKDAAEARMPYYFGEGDPGWDDYLERQEAENLAWGGRQNFAYLTPWQAKTTTLSFPRHPRPRRSETTALPPTPSVSRLSRLWRRLLAWRREPSGPDASTARASIPQARPEVGSPEWMMEYAADQKSQAAEALEQVSIAAAAFRDAGVRYVFIRYDGGNDEGFTHFEAVEMSDGRRLGGEDAEARRAVRAAVLAAQGEETDVDAFEKFGFAEIFDAAAIALLGPGFGTGAYEFYGAVTIDCQECLLKDDQSPERAFAGVEGRASDGVEK